MKRKAMISRKPVRSNEVPVTVGMLYEMEGRLVTMIKSETSEVKSEIFEVKSEVSGVKSEISGLKSDIHRLGLLIEEQTARNAYVLDGYSQLYALIEAKLG